MTNLVQSSDRKQDGTVRFVDSWASVHLDLLRAVAALLVLLGHWRDVFFVDYPQLASHRALWAAPYVLCGAGHQAVVVFFVLSGFLVGGSVLRAVEKNQWEWRSYLIRRSVRLWIVLLPALLLCQWWDRLGIHLGYATALYHGRAVNHVLGNVSQLLSARLFFSNLFYLQGTYTTAYGSDGALWSLAFEFWYYILFPLGLLVFLRSVRWRVRLVWGGLFVAVAWFVGSAILWSFPIWLAGVLLHRTPRLRLLAHVARATRIVALLIYLPLFFYLAKGHLFSSLAGDYVLMVFTFLLLWILLADTARHPLHSDLVLVSRGLARFSYTLYAVHTPLIVFLASCTVHSARWQPSVLHVLLACSVLLVVVGYSFGVAWATEFRTDAVREWIEDRMGRRAEGSARDQTMLEPLIAENR
jgi:peptidoglycan/LPS O-acetylase OafA/YrhL